MSTFVFSCTSPHVPFHTDVVDKLACVFHRAVERRLGKVAESLPALNGLYHEALLPMTSEVEPTALVWQPEMGAGLACLKRGDPMSAMVHSLFAAHALGPAKASWSIVLPKPSRFSLGGHLFDLEGVVTVHADGCELLIQCDDGHVRRLELYQDGKLWQARDPGSIATEWGYSPPAFARYPEFGSVYVQPWRLPPNAPGLVDVIIDWPPGHEYAATAKEWWDASSPADQLGRALEVLHTLSHDYTDWIRPMFRGIAATPITIDGARQSGSYVDHAGVFNCGFPVEPEALAEVIVHEISHQYMMLLSSVVSLVEKKSGEVYFSSIKGRKRPLDRVLLGYHAAANMTLYWLDVVEMWGTSPSREEALASMRDHACEMADVLERSQGLTQSGALMVQMLEERLKEKIGVSVAAQLSES